MSGCSSRATFAIPESSNNLDIVEVSEKLSLHPKV
jgi:hypothetical protein